MNTPLVSIMIPCYNQAVFIGKAIQSALDQDYQNVEVIVSDDNSSDETASVVEKFQDPRIQYIKHNQQLGRVKNYRKLVFELAHGTYAINLDGDDYFVSKTFISQAVKKLEQDSKMVLVFGRQQFHDLSDGRTWANPSPQIASELTAAELLKNLPQWKEVMPHIASLYRRSAALKADVFAHDIVFADAQALIQIAGLGHSAFINEIVGTWVRNGRNESYRPDFEKRTRNFLMIDEPARFFALEKILTPLEAEQWSKKMALKLGRETACLYLDFKDRENYSQLMKFLEKKYGVSVREQVEADLRVRLRRWIPSFSKYSELAKSFLPTRGS